MNSSPRPVRRFSRWQTRKHKFVLGGTTFTTGNDVKVSTIHDGGGNEGKSAKFQSSPALTDELIDTTQTKTALVNLSQNVQSPGCIKELQSSDWKETGQKNFNANNLENEQILQGTCSKENSFKTSCPITDDGIRKSSSNKNKKSFKGSNSNEGSSSRISFCGKENAESTATKQVLDPTTPNENGVPGVCSPFHSIVVNESDENGINLSSSQRKKIDKERKESSPEPLKPINDDIEINENVLLEKEIGTPENLETDENQMGQSVLLAEKSIEQDLNEKSKKYSMENSLETDASDELKWDKNESIKSLRKSSMKDVSSSSKKGSVKSLFLNKLSTSSPPSDHLIEKKSQSMGKNGIVTDTNVCELSVSVPEKGKSTAVYTVQGDRERSLSFNSASEQSHLEPSSTTRSLRNRNTVKKTPIVQYPVEFLSSKQVKSLSSKAKKILFNTSVTSTKSKSQDKLRMVPNSDLMDDLEICHQQSPRNEMISEQAKGNKSERNVFSSKDNSGNMSIEMENNKPPAKRSDYEKENCVESSECSPPKKAKQKKLQQMDSDTNLFNENKNKKNNGVQVVSNSKSLKVTDDDISEFEFDLNGNDMKKKTETVTRKRKTKEACFSENNSANSIEEKQNHNLSLKGKGKSNGKAREQQITDVSESSLLRRNLRIRNNSSTSAVIQYPLEFLSSKQVKSLSIKAQKMLMNASVNKSKVSETNESSSLENKIKCFENTTRRDSNDKLITNPNKNNISSNGGKSAQSVLQSKRSREHHSQKLHVKNSRKGKRKTDQRRKYSLPQKKSKEQNDSKFESSTEIIAELSDSISQSLVVVNINSPNDEISCEPSKKDCDGNPPAGKASLTSNAAQKQSQQLNDTVCGVHKVGRKRKLFSDSDDLAVSKPNHDIVKTSKSYSSSMGGTHLESENSKALAKKDSKKRTASSKSKEKQCTVEEPVAIAKKADASKGQTFESRLKTRFKPADLKQNEVLISDWMSAYRHLIDQLSSRNP